MGHRLPEVKIELLKNFVILILHKMELDSVVSLFCFKKYGVAQFILMIHRKYTKFIRNVVTVPKENTSKYILKYFLELSNSQGI